MTVLSDQRVVFFKLFLCCSNACSLHDLASCKHVAPPACLRCDNNTLHACYCKNIEKAKCYRTCLQSTLQR
ncbi:MAG TPA: hypothetical protein DDX19_18050 [Rhodopirellula baltica]|nr:hypothetical protein [Rhodopirellula baltica]